MTVNCERKGKRIVVKFDYDPNLVEKMRTISGRSFKRADRSWTVPLDMSVCRQLRELYGKDLRIGPALRSWAINERREEDSLRSMAEATHADLPVLRERLPDLWRALYFGPLRRTYLRERGGSERKLDAAEHLFSFMAGVPPWTHGSYQTADVRFLADAKAPLNANQQGLGKTLEAIAEIFESGRHLGWHLIIAPSSAVDGTWEPELEAWLAPIIEHVGIFACYGRRRVREDILHRAIHSDKPINFVVVNPAMVQFRKDTQMLAMIGIIKLFTGTKLKYPANRGILTLPAKEREHRIACRCGRIKATHWHYDPGYPDLMAIYWDSIINDEVHKGNIRNHRTITGHSMVKLKLNDGGKFVAMSGTPMKKKGADIWGVLHWLRGDVFTSYWNFAENFFEIKKNKYGMKVDKLRESREDAFYAALTPYVLRRTKREVLPWLPDKMHITIPVTLGDKQRNQYDRMEAEGIAYDEDEDTQVAQTSILAEFTRLQQFANSYYRVMADKTMHARTGPEDSAKLDALFEKLDEAGALDGSAETPTVIFSRFKEMLDIIAFRLKKAKVTHGYIHGGIKDRRQLVQDFQSGRLPVLLVVTSAGGVSLTLDAADTAHFLEPSWAPDEKEQAEDRIHRASRVHQVTIYTYIAKDTIDQYIEETAFEKATEHERILDIRRRIKARHAD